MSLGPLTTTYVPPASCTSSFLTDYKPPGGWDVMGPLKTTGDCFPPNYSDDGKKYYSPGICPAGYTAACADPAPGQGGGQTTVTTATCCPTGFTCQSVPYVLYGSTFACNSHILAFTGNQVFISSGETLSTEYATISAGQIAIANAFGVQIQFKAEDFYSTTTSATTSPPSPTPTSTASVSQPTSNGAGENARQAGLSTGAAAGIGVGAGVAALLFIGGFIWAVYVRRRNARKRSVLRKEHATKSTSGGEQMSQTGIYSSSSGYPQHHPVANLGHPIAELGGGDLRELDGREMGVR
ncbi:hypothetical protein HD806DRAFT_226136 [Xylariaceae sp. AK1471]|nr:hypothetical protein HD806DRAFT_226136 [Xylariaceae sp. AK1471]